MKWFSLFGQFRLNKNYQYLPHAHDIFDLKFKQHSIRLASFFHTLLRLEGVYIKFCDFAKLGKSLILPFIS